MPNEREIAEIEAVLRGHLDCEDGAVGGIYQAAVVIAALRAKDREDGAREMRERAAEAAESWLAIWGSCEIRHTSAREYASDAVADVRDVIRALPLTPKESGDA
ncbi:hypothetical protein HNR00_003523 [Methylorubrum rhodinum]|uniref:Uncharacterized protein n=1 Tax=Methylorubrum rhodinum TaxID=29428 RepID=A0A840ZMH9_9HYPH|nr:hypothetical protein [Methylorubrum rhodinum]MBB5758796.1 hypothetical protein [Methylorubrum rhodinum]